MIEIVTGLPGAGKTLITLARIKTQAEADNRTVYYSGIADLRLPWIELDKADQWHKVPPGSIVVIDEAQRVFRPRGNGAAVPEHVQALETHRHSGIDLVLITQHPMLLDTNVRRLAGRHIHTVRAFGAKFATLHEWPGVREQCDRSRADSIERKWFYPTVAYDWYKSAEVHTHRRRLPLRLLALLLVPILLIAAVYTFMRWQSGTQERVRNKIETVTGISGTRAPAPAPVKSVDAYLAEQKPRIHGLAYTAPVYDDITKPVHAPYPAACVDWPKKGCRCYSEQGTRLDVPPDLCGQIVAQGFYIAWDTAGKGSGKGEPQKAPDAPVSRAEDRPAGAVSWGIAAPPAATLSANPAPAAQAKQPTL